MTRKQEIKQAAKEYCVCSSIKDAFIENPAFMMGAEWADSHPINQWHKVEDGLPPRIKETVNFSKTVIVSNGLSYGTGYYNYNLNKWFCVGTTNITHWMELPELPKEK
jgi:hypothetical protein